MFGYESRDESGEGPQGGRSKKHLQEITQSLNKGLPAGHRGVVRAGEEPLRCAEREEEESSQCETLLCDPSVSHQRAATLHLHPQTQTGVCFGLECDYSLEILFA